MRRFGQVLLLGLAVACCPGVLVGQEPTPSAADVVGWWAEGSGPSGPEDRLWLGRILGERDQADPALLEEIFDRLTTIAQGGGERSYAALKAIGHFSAVYYKSDHASLAPEVFYPGMVERIVSIYEVADSDLKEAIILHFLPVQADRVGATRALGAIVSGEMRELDRNDKDARSRPDWALDILVNTTGPEGRSELQRLHESGNVQSPHLVTRLDELAKTAFRPSGR